VPGRRTGGRETEREKGGGGWRKEGMGRGGRGGNEERERELGRWGREEKDGGRKRRKGGKHWT
jgi:hypothetical protein